MTRGDDEFEAMLRRALHAEADMVVPEGDGLSKIRERVATQKPWHAWLRPSLLALGTAAVVGVGGVGALVAQQDTQQAPGGPAAAGPATHMTGSPSPSTDASTSAPAASASASAPTGEPASPTAAVPPVSPSGDGPLSAATVPVYRVGQTESGPRLYREFTSVMAPSGAAGEVAAAVAEAVDGDAVDPDYSSPWSSGARVRSVSVAGDRATVDLSAAAADTLAGQVEAQQLVWTATAADTSVRRVQFEVEGDPTGGPVARAAQAEVLAPVWVIDPAQGASVGRTFTVHGDASVFEANVSWQVLGRGGEVADEGFATTSQGAPGRGTWSTQATVDTPGTYVVRAFESSAEDGSARYVDTKQVVVR
ncbi:MAG: Gmad2 immunoglobulin-like domain-containing protein [Actinomycetes bacterium]